ncbi:LicD family protein [Sphingobacterium thalpophilum]|uniref:LicD family protein n=1 Tax=Sphingobacterium thalpophilum TaxID=259 RepID=UPI003D976464
MKVYIIKTDGSGRPIPYLTAQSGDVAIPSCCIRKINQQIFFEKYGVEITDYEIENYKAHFSIWNHFINSHTDGMCVIVEDGVKINVSLEEVQLEISQLEDWDVFFPYDKISEEGRMLTNEVCASQLKYFWGSYFYFINESGARKMIEYDTITQPVDEELLAATISGSIKAFCSKTDWFEYNESSSPSFISRNRSIKDAIFNHHAWTLETKRQAIDIIHHLSSVAEKMNIDLFLDAGTLLGAVRHGGIMPWDDDIDLAIDSQDIDRFIQEVERQGIVQHCTWMWGHTNQRYHKFWLESGIKTEGFPYLFPFIDIWIFFQKDEYIHTCDGRKYRREVFFPAQETIFEDCKLKLPNNYLAILDVKYRDWKTHIKVYTWSHRIKARTFKPLSLPIQVNQHGRYSVGS